MALNWIFLSLLSISVVHLLSISTVRLIQSIGSFQLTKVSNWNFQRFKWYDKKLMQILFPLSRSYTSLVQRRNARSSWTIFFHLCKNRVSGLLLWIFSDPTRDEVLWSNFDQNWANWRIDSVNCLGNSQDRDLLSQQWQSWQDCLVHRCSGYSIIQWSLLKFIPNSVWKNFFHHLSWLSKE